MGLRGYVHAQSDWRRITLVAPWLTWGAVEGTTAGELLRVAYTVTHPGVVNAKLLLADGRELEMTVFPDHLEVLLPPDTPDGPATVRAYLAEPGGAGAWPSVHLGGGYAYARAWFPAQPAVTEIAELVVFLTGVVVPLPEAKPAGGMPRRRRPQRLVRATPARVVLVTAPVNLTRRQLPVRVPVPTRARVRVLLRRSATPRAFERQPARLRIVAGAASVQAVLRATASASALRAGETAVAHRDGPALEEALLLELL